MQEEQSKECALTIGLPRDILSHRKTTIDIADEWWLRPSLRLLGEGPADLATLKKLCQSGKIAGPVVHDARIAALCLDHRVKELWSADRDFSRFKGLKVRNPL